jgi:hypothetical protein
MNRCLRSILNIRWPNIILNNSLWEITKQEPTDIQIKKRKWRWIEHTLRKPAGAIEKDVIDWIPQGTRRRGRPRKTRRTTEEEITEMGKTWREGIGKSEKTMEKLHRSPMFPFRTRGIKSNKN